MVLDRRLLEPRVLAALDRSAAQGIPFRASTGYVHTTWARTFSSRPELFVQPQTALEVEHAVDLARQCGRRIVAVGSGHSPSALTLSSAWMVNLDALDRVLAVDTTACEVTVEAGMRLWRLNDVLAEHGLALANLGSIEEQSVAGVLATGTHGSTCEHGVLSEDVRALRIVLADGKTRTCSAAEDPDLFRAALLSLGALGIITHITLRVVPAFSLAWQQTIDTEAALFRKWRAGALWTQAPYVRVWWLPYTGRAVTWRASFVTDLAVTPHRDPPRAYYDGALGSAVYHNLLWLARWAPPLLPWVEWFVFGMQYGFRDGAATGAVQPGRQALLMNCLYSQYVNEWALPLAKGPEALQRLACWLRGLRPGDAGYVPHGIPFSARGLYVHAPVEVRVSDSTFAAGRAEAPPPLRAFLDPTERDGPTLYLNAIMYRPYRRDAPGTARYYQGFEWLMRELGGRPHWAKNFSSGLETRQAIEAGYGGDLREWRRVRDRADPEGMFVGAWHRQFVLDGPLLPLEETEVARAADEGGGVLWTGEIKGERAKLS